MNDTTTKAPEDVSLPDEVAVLPLRGTVMFPTASATIVVGEDRARRLIADVQESGRLVALVAQRDPFDIPSCVSHVYPVGTLAAVSEVQMLVQGDERTLQVGVQGKHRVRLLELVRSEPYLVARVVPMPKAREGSGTELDAITQAARELFRELCATAPEIPDELAGVLQTLTKPEHIAYFIASSAPIPLPVRQEILELDSVASKLNCLLEALQHELVVRRVVRQITAQTTVELSKEQRDAVLRKQLETIQRELGMEDSERAEVETLRRRLAALDLPEEARKESERELERLARTPTVSPEHGMIRTFLDWVVKLPWGRLSGAAIDEIHARRVLDEDHYDLEAVKARIVEYLAVRALREERKGELGLDTAQHAWREPILCFVGPPGVGKTSLGQSIARALGRRFVRVSLGGIHDEAEIRGHRRTYIGAMPGRPLAAMARIDAADPVFMLDEVDKLGVGFHGDPSAALLELLDPAQNDAFVDTYLGVPFDLSKVLFICTANTVETIPAPLLDRMEVLPLAGYTDEEKLHIAQRYLLPKQQMANGLREGEAVLSPKVVRHVVRAYTRESGVRNLERELATLLRKVVLRVREGAPTPIEIIEQSLREYLGPARFFDEVAERTERAGVATGLSWTATGGDILFIEATMMPAGPEEEPLILTGKLGDVMRESAQAALSYLRSSAHRLGIDPSVFRHKVIHVHVPAGAIPKDGPSAGVTILTALASLVLRRPVRGDLAMTGEITLRGKVLAVGGIKEKILAAHRAGLRRIVLPRRNESALEDVPDEVRAACELILVDSVEEVLGAALSLGNGRAASSVPRPH